MLWYLSGWQDMKLVKFGDTAKKAAIDKFAIPCVSSFPTIKCWGGKERKKHNKDPICIVDVVNCIEKL